MDTMLGELAQIKADVEFIENELKNAKTSDTFKYARSRDIRKSTMGIIRAARNIRIDCLTEFKSRKEK